MPITAVIIVALFAVQRWGTAAVGALFGPVMIVWFVAIGACGVSGIVGHSDILRALSPAYAVKFMVGDFGTAFFSLAGVVLAVTGAEALYADMGHFGRKAITRAWVLVVLPALVLSYLGQGALVLSDKTAMSAPFFLLTPGWATITDGAVGHRRNDYHLPSGDHRGVFAGVPGRPARLFTEVARGAHLRVNVRPGLHAVDQRHALGGRPDPGSRVP